MAIRNINNPKQPIRNTCTMEQILPPPSKQKNTKQMESKKGALYATLCYPLRILYYLRCSAALCVVCGAQCLFPLTHNQSITLTTKGEHCVYVCVCVSTMGTHVMLMYVKEGWSNVVRT